VQLLFTITPALIISFAVCSSAAILLSGMLIYHDITDKVNSKGWERGVAAFTEILQISLLSVGLYAVAVALRSGCEVYWYDTVVLSTLHLFVSNNVGSVLFCKWLN
jgi:hypothetical protein